MDICPPAQIYPIVMSAFILFNIYRGFYRHAISNAVLLIMGTILLWFLCVAKFEFVAYSLLLMPVIFCVFLLALILFDNSLLDINHEHKSCKKEKESCCPSKTYNIRT